MKQHKSFKVWKINDCDWVWGRSFLQAVQAYMYQTGISLEEAFHDESIINSAEMELSDEAMDTLMFTDEDGTKRTFSEELDRRIESNDDEVGFFCSTEF